MGRDVLFVRTKAATYALQAIITHSSQQQATAGAAAGAAAGAGGPVKAEGDAAGEGAAAVGLLSPGGTKILVVKDEPQEGQQGQQGAGEEDDEEDEEVGRLAPGLRSHAMLWFVLGISFLPAPVAEHSPWPLLAPALPTLTCLVQEKQEEEQLGEPWLQELQHTGV